MLGIKEGGSIKIFPRKIFVSWCRIFCTATLLCSVSEISQERRTLWIVGGGGVPRFSVEKFLSHGGEYFLGQPFCAVFQKFSGSEELYG